MVDITFPRLCEREEFDQGDALPQGSALPAVVTVFAQPAWEEGEKGCQNGVEEEEMLGPATSRCQGAEKQIQFLRRLSPTWVAGTVGIQHRKCSAGGRAGDPKEKGRVR